MKYVYILKSINFPEKFYIGLTNDLKQRFIDSTKLVVCNNLRISSNKVFKGVAKRGKTSTGWFYGFKLHLIINEYGEIIAFDISARNVDDRNPGVIERLTNRLKGKLFGDRGYLSKILFQNLYSRGIQLFTKLKSNMKSATFSLQDKILLNKRGIIETVNGQLKFLCQVEYTRHRSVHNFFVNTLAAIAAYSFLPNKPSIVSLNPAQITYQ